MQLLLNVLKLSDIVSGKMQELYCRKGYLSMNEDTNKFFKNSYMCVLRLVQSPPKEKGNFKV